MKVNIVTLPSDDLEGAVAFYRDALDFAADTIAVGDDHVAFHVSDDFSLVLQDRAAFAKISGGEAAGAVGECMMSLVVSTEEDVGATVQRALAAGAKAIGGIECEPWGCLGRFRAPDGRLWEIVCWRQK